MIDLAQEPLDSHIVQFLFTAPQNGMFSQQFASHWSSTDHTHTDGGQFSMVTSLLDKYGIVPQTLYPESFNSSNSSRVDQLLTTKLREDALDLRAVYAKHYDQAQSAALSTSDCAKLASSACRKRKDTQLAEIYKILSITLGAPPKPTDSFTWEYYDKNGKFHTLTSSPQDFYQKSVAPFKADEMVSLINDPRVRLSTHLRAVCRLWLT